MALYLISNPTTLLVLLGNIKHQLLQILALHCKLKQEAHHMMMLQQRLMVVSKRVALILVIIATAMAVMGESRRLTMKSRAFESLLQNRLPRGPVPPSAPSFCHNKLDPSTYVDTKFQQQVVCPWSSCLYLNSYFLVYFYLQFGNYLNFIIFRVTV